MAQRARWLEEGFGSGGPVPPIYLLYGRGLPFAMDRARPSATLTMAQISRNSIQIRPTPDGTANRTANAAIQTRQRQWPSQTPLTPPS